MTEHNPFQPPRTAVDDVQGQDDGVQPVNPWSVKGRIGRARLLAYTIGASLFLGLMSGIVSGLLGGKAGRLASELSWMPMMVFWTMVAIQRAHDMAWPGWTVLFPLVPQIGCLSIEHLMPHRLGSLVWFVFLIFALLIGLVWLLKPGTKGRNAYGAPPPRNPVGVLILAWLLPGLVVAGILAAVAIPAYQDYKVRAEARELMKDGAK